MKNAKPTLSIGREVKLVDNEAIEELGNKSLTATQRTTSTKPKPITQVKRDTFTLPAFDYAIIDKTIQRAAMSGKVLNKSEVIRAGLIKLSKMTDKELIKLTQSVIKIKTGRPSENNDK